MATGQSPLPQTWLRTRLYADPVCDDDAAEAAYAAILALYKRTFRVTSPFCVFVRLPLESNPTLEQDHELFHSFVFVYHCSYD